MAQTVFISHAGGDSERAAQVAEILRTEDILVRLDRAELAPGHNFVQFMERALTTSDYCLLLWSARAAATPWVEVEWHSAFHRSVTEKRAFLLVGRLENEPLPALLRPRLYCDLFPQLRPGLTQIVAAWRADRAAEARTERPVAQPRTGAAATGGPHTVYVTSELFAITVPWQCDLERPAVALLNAVVEQYRLPAQIDHEGRIGMRFAYRLVYGERALDAALSLASQGLPNDGVVWIEATVRTFAATPDLAGQGTASVMRSTGETPPLLLDAVQRAGLGFI